MALKIGTLEADISGDLSGLKSAKDVAIGVYSKIAKEGEKAEKSNKSFWASFGGAKQVKKPLQEVNSNLKETNKTLDIAKVKANGMGRGVGQLGIQLGQFAGQIQGGQNALLAFSQQASDVGIVLGQMFGGRAAAIGGIAGAVISIASALLGSFLPALFKSKSAVSELSDATEKLGKVAKNVGSNDLVILSEEVSKLAKESEDAARAMLKGGIADALKVIEIASEGARKEVMKFADERLFGDPSELKRGQVFQSLLADLQKKFNINRKEAVNLAKALRMVEDRPGSQSLNNLQETLDKIVSKSTNENMIDLANTVRTFSKESDEAANKLSKLQGFLKDIEGASKQAQGVGSSNVDSRIAELEKLGLTEIELIRKQFQEREAFILANTQLTENKRNELLQKAASDRDSQINEILQREKDLEDKRIEQVANRIEKIKQLGETERDRIFREFEERKTFILEQDQLTESERLSLIEQAAEARISAIRSINEREINEEERKNKKIIDEQQRRLNTQLNGMRAMSAAIGNIFDATEQGGAARFASIISGVATMASQIAGLMQAQATAQAMADPTAVTLPQKIANIASVVSVFAGIVSTISAARGGGRQHGGMTSGMQFHEVNERGLPELLNVGNRQFLMPTGKNARVEPISSTQNAANVNVQVINNAPAQIGIEQNNMDVKIYVDEQVERLENKINTSASTGRGDFAKNLNQGFELKRRL